MSRPEYEEWRRDPRWTDAQWIAFSEWRARMLNGKSSRQKVLTPYMELERERRWERERIQDTNNMYEKYLKEVWEE